MYVLIINYKVHYKYKNRKLKKSVYIYIYFNFYYNEKEQNYKFIKIFSKIPRIKIDT